MSLTKGAAIKLHQDAESEPDYQPLFQVLSIKKIGQANAGAQDRHRLILSDGDHYIQAMLATQLNRFIENGEIEKNSVIRLTSYALNYVSERKLIIALGVEPVSKHDEKFGNPSSVETVSDTAPSSTTAPAAAAVALAPAAAGGARGGFSSAKGAAPSTTTTASGARGGSTPAAARGGGGANRAGGGRGGDHGPLYPIEGLSPYQNKWTIKARVIQKSDIKVWSNQRGEGKLFSVTFMDDSGEIKATGFNEQCDAFYDLLQEGKVYFVTKARIQIAKKQFSTVNNDYEISFDSKTEIEPCEDEGAVPQVKYNFVELSTLGDLEKDNTCDVLVVIKDVGELSSITSRATQKPIPKRDITVVDRSEFSVRLTLWGKTAENFSTPEKTVIAFKGVKVGDFGGRTLSMFSSSTMSVNPDIPEAFSLRGWYDSLNSLNFKSHAGAGGGGGASGGAGSRDVFKTIGEVRDEGIGMNDRMEWFTVKATISYIKLENCSYPACSTDGCNKKVVEDGGSWRCEKCDKSWDSPTWRYILSISTVDHTGQSWITAFNEAGEQLLGVTANELQALKQEDDSAAQAVLERACGQSWNFNCSAKMDTFQEQTRARFSIKRAWKLDYKQESKSLIEKINAYGVAI